MAYNLNVSFSFLVNGTSLQQGSTIATAREIIRKDGFGRQGLNKGLTSTLGRHGVFNMIYFGFYHNVRDLIPQAEVFKKTNTKAQVIFTVMPYFIQKRITYSQYRYVWTQTFFFSFADTQFRDWQKAFDWLCVWNNSFLCQHSI